MNRRSYEGTGGGGGGNSAPTPTPAYASFLDAYFEHVRDTSAMFRSINDTLRAAAPNQTHTRSAGRAAPTTNSNVGTNSRTINRVDDIDFISGVTFNIPIHDTETNIFNLLASYINNPTAANTMQAPAQAPAQAPGIVATNTVSMRYMDIEQARRPYDSCPITGDTFTNEVPVSMMRCGHYFSENGISRWLITHTTCPICRYDFRAVATSDHDIFINNNNNNNNTNNNNNNNNNNI